MDWLTPLQYKCTQQTLKFDVGANEGGYTSAMLQFPGKIVALEPIPQLATQLLKRFRDEPRVEVLPWGVSNQSVRRSGLAVHEAWTLDNPETAKRGRNQYCLEQFGTETFTVQFCTIDQLVAGYGYARPPRSVDFLKIDTDGYEFRVLQGAERTIQKFRPWMLFEFNYMVEDLGDSVVEMLDFIYHRLNYVVVEAEAHHTQGEIRERIWWADHYPWHTTFDVGLIPRDEVEQWNGVHRA